MVEIFALLQCLWFRDEPNMNYCKAIFTYETAAQCEQYKKNAADVNDGDRGIKYVCASKTVATWQPVERR
jgi:hypothetical protein